jgi:glycosyltransferase involved in cell wall biosynthesis
MVDERQTKIPIIINHLPLYMTVDVCFVSLSAYGYFSSDIPAGGGAERQLSLIASELSDQLNVSFIVGDFGQPAIKEKGNITLYRAYRRDSSAKTFERVFHFWKLFRAMKQADADVYVYRGHPRKAAVTFFLAKFLGGSWVYNLANDSNVNQDYNNISPIFQRFVNICLRGADEIIAQTEYQQQQLRNHFDTTSTVVPNGYPTSEAEIPFDDRKYFLWVGRLDPDQKRPHRFLDIANRLEDTSFQIAGIDGPDPAYNMTIRNRAKTINNVKFLGYVPPDKIHEYYRSALALVSTSDYEGFPNTFLESWRVGTPVMSLTVDPGRYIDVDMTGYCEDSFELLTKNLRRLTSDYEYWNHHSKPARRYFEQNYAIESVSDQYEKVIQRVA